MCLIDYTFNISSIFSHWTISRQESWTLCVGNKTIGLFNKRLWFSVCIDFVSTVEFVKKFNKLYTVNNIRKNLIFMHVNFRMKIRIIPFGLYTENLTLFSRMLMKQSVTFWKELFRYFCMFSTYNAPLKRSSLIS